MPAVADHVVEADLHARRSQWAAQVQKIVAAVAVVAVAVAVVAVVDTAAEEMEIGLGIVETVSVEPVVAVEP